MLYSDHNELNPDLLKGRGLSDWGAALPESPTRAWLLRLRLRSYDTLLKYQLPTVPLKIMGLTALLRCDPSKWRTLKPPLYALIEHAQAAGRPYFSAFGLSTQDLKEVAQNWHRQHGPDYRVLVAKQLEFSHEGAILAEPNGRTTIELVEGSVLPLSRGAVNPLVTAVRDEFLGTVRTSTSDYDLRIALARTIHELPRIVLDDRLIPLPGYYEFGLFRAANSDLLTPLFFECRPNLEGDNSRAI